MKKRNRVTIFVSRREKRKERENRRKTKECINLFHKLEKKKKRRLS